MRQRGFTLLEILVVVAIVAVMSAALLLSARGAGSDRQIEEEARRLDRILQLLCDQAVVEGRFAGLGYSAKAYAGYELGAQGWRAIEHNGPLKMHELRAGLGIREVGAEQPLPPSLPKEPQVLCAPTGDLSEHDLVLAAITASEGWRLALDRDGKPSLSAWTRP